MWDRFRETGVDLAAIVVDSVEQNRSMVDKLLLPFPILSDPESRVIGEWGVLNEAEARIAKPAIFGIRPDWSIGYRYVGEDFADRPDDDELFAGLKEVTPGGQR
ncbi:MAG: peroxiredoxin family protein [Chloroflexi bacterium]|nr:MAG: peroxiredoxin family protein [Chloroflexota bacterium]